MLTTETNIDPYTLVAHHLQEGEATRAELKASTNLDYAQISAALERFEIMESVQKRADGAGIDHYSWTGKPYQPDPPRPVRRVEAAPAEDKAKNKDGVANEEELRLPAVRPKGWSLVGKVRELLRDLSDGEEFSMPIVYNSLLDRYPDACETYEASSLRTQIAATLNSMIGRDITLISRGNGRDPNTYKKGVDSQSDSDPDTTTTDPARVENLFAAGKTTTEICAELGISQATYVRHRKANWKLERAERVGTQRRQAIEAYEEKQAAASTKVSARRDGNRPVSRPATIPKLGIGSVTMDGPEPAGASGVADFSPSDEEAKEATPYQVVLNDLRAEREELNQLITLLEKREATAARNLR